MRDLSNHGLLVSAFLGPKSVLLSNLPLLCPAFPSLFAEALREPPSSHAAITSLRALCRATFTHIQVILHFDRSRLMPWYTLMCYATENKNARSAICRPPEKYKVKTQLSLKRQACMKSYGES